MSALSLETIGALARELLTDDEPCVLLCDLPALRANLAAMRAAFPAGTLHAVAIKANPLRAILAELVAAGCGLEAASPIELELALRAAPAERVVFDSPVKTESDLRRALALECVLNLDNLQEIARVDAILAGARPRARVGLRVNPDVGAGSIAATSTAVAGSKFGVCLRTSSDAVVEAFSRHSWLTGLHVHVGSAGCSLAQLVAGAKAIVQLAESLDSRIETLDIGGGMPVDLEDPRRTPSFREYADRLRTEVPTLFDGRHQIITEMGRRVHADTTVAVSRVEATKQSGGRNIALIHLGADLLLRAAYMPGVWEHRIRVLDRHGTPRTGPLEPWDIAGPLCFSGDLIARARPLPAIEPGDLLVVHDVGAYTLSMWSRYNSRASPAVWAHDDPGPRRLRARESLEDVLRFWD
ncbi:diaminopimelate decarboxylase [Nannocystaceae bacterium ST9]